MVQPRPGGGKGRAASAVSSRDSCPGSYLPPSLRAAVRSPGKVGSQGQSKGTPAGSRFRKGPACYLRVLLAAVVFAGFSAQKNLNHQLPN